MSKLVVSARPAGGYWFLGRKWGAQPEELEIVEQPAEEIASDADDHAVKHKKHELAKQRVNEGKITAGEAELIRRDPHMAEATIPTCASCEKLKARIAELEGQLAPKAAQLESGGEEAEATTIEKRTSGRRF